MGKDMVKRKIVSLIIFFISTPNLMFGGEEMKRIAVCMMLVVFLGVGLVVIAGPGYSRGASVGSMGLTFSISQPEAEFTESEPIPLNLVIKNGSEHQRMIPSLFVNVKDDPISLRSGMYMICQKGTDILPFKGAYFKTSGVGVTLTPGATHEAFELDLSKCFDLKGGTYDIQLLFTTRYSGFVDAASNRLTFTVKKGRNSEPTDAPDKK